LQGKKSSLAEQRAVTETRGKKKREFTTYGRRVRQLGKSTGMLQRKKQKAQLELNQASTVKYNKNVFINTLSTE